jgi:site-specific recombinase XerD
MPPLRMTALEWVHERQKRRELARASVTTYRRVLMDFTGFVGATVEVGAVTQRQVEEWLSECEVGPNSTRMYLGIVRQFCRWCVQVGYMRRDPTANIPGPRQPRYQPRRLTPDQIAKVFAAAKDDRERLMVSLAANEGLRVGEIARVERGDIDWFARRLVVRGKGGHERVLPVTAATWGLLVAYVEQRSAGAVITSRRPGCEYDALTASTVSAMLCKVIRRAGFKETGHALRHTAAAETLEAGANIRQVQAMLGHANVQTTSRYLGPVDAEGLREFMDARATS